MSWPHYMSTPRHRGFKSLRVDQFYVGGGDGDKPESSSKLPDGVFPKILGKLECLECRFCGVTFANTESDIASHEEQPRHQALRLNSLMKKRMKEAAQLTPEKRKVLIECASPLVHYNAQRDEFCVSAKVAPAGAGPQDLLRVDFSVKNVSANSRLRYHYWTSTVCPESVRLLPVAEEQELLSPNMSKVFSVELTPTKTEETFAFVLLFFFKNEMGQGSTVFGSCQVKVAFQDALTEELAKTAGEYKHGTRRDHTYVTPRLHLKLGDRPDVKSEGNRLEKSRGLQGFDMPEHVREFINQGLNVKKCSATPKGPDHLPVQQYKEVLGEAVTFNSYGRRMEILLFMEEHQATCDLELYTLRGVTLKRCNTLMALQVPGLAEKRPSVLRGDQIRVRRELLADQHDSVEYLGFVHQVEESRVLLGFHKDLMNMHIEGMKFMARFIFNRFPMRLQHRVLTLIEDLNPLLFPTGDTACIHGALCPAGSQLKFYSRSPSPNEEQARAIRHIVEGSSRPAPYIVFGPPGTGKTFTIVEAMKQIHKRMPDARILACAPSNSAADLLAEKLLEHMPVATVHRMNSLNRPVPSIPTILLEKGVCNYDPAERDMYFNSRDEFVRSEIRFFVCTLITAGRLASAEFEKDFFTHIFVDEASQATEPETLVPIAGLLNPGTRTDTGKQLVLAGDPKQLGPCLRSPLAKKFGLETSLMERLMDTALYRRQDSPDPDGLYYNPLLITKLLTNYRSHPAILATPNALFYNDELRATDSNLQDVMVGWEPLPNPKKPVLFKPVIGEDMREKSSPSFFNPQEVTAVLKYVQMLVDKPSPKKLKIRQKDIGVIAPYSKQVQKIRKTLRDKQLADIKVGSVEEFQGQERLVIIISCVRSDPRYLNTDSKFGLGFLKNDRRFNVAVTRAKALLVVIGNPNVLCHSHGWERFINFCIDNRCMVDPHMFRRDDNELFKMMIDRLQNLDLEQSLEDLSEADTREFSAINNEDAANRDRE